MYEKRSPQHDIRWIVAGAAAILIAGMAMVSFLSTRSAGDHTATIAAIVSMVTLGVGGVFGLASLSKAQDKRVDGVSEQIEANTAITEGIQHQLNGGLDLRMRACAEQAIIDAMPMIRQTMVEVLDDYTRPR